MVMFSNVGVSLGSVLGLFLPTSTFFGDLPQCNGLNALYILVTSKITSSPGLSPTFFRSVCPMTNSISIVGWLMNVSMLAYPKLNFWSSATPYVFYL